MYLFESNATFSNCVFYQNTTISSGSGAGGYFEDSNITITDLFSIQMMPTILEVQFAVMIRI